LSIFQTKRLSIRELSDADVSNISLVLCDPDIMHFSTVGVHTDSQLKQYIKNCRQQYLTSGYGRWGIFSTPNNDFIGLCGLIKEDDGLVHINYRLATKYHGKGYASETAKALLDYASKTLKLKTVSALIELENKASIKVAIRAGFELKGPFSFKGIDAAEYIWRKE